MTSRLRTGDGGHRPFRRAIAGLGLGWILLPPLVLLAAAGRAQEGLWSIGAAALAGLMGVALGVFCATSGLGGLGLLAAGAAGLAGALLPYFVVPLVRSLKAPGVALYGDYLPVVAIAIVMAIIGLYAARRVVRRLPVPAVPLFVCGLAVLLLWLLVWLLVSPVTRLG